MPRSPGRESSVSTAGPSAASAIENEQQKNAAIGSFMSNPYQTPAFDPKHFQDQPAFAPGAASDYGWVSQVRIFALLNAVQGLLEIPVGLFVAGIGIALPALQKLEQAKNNNAGRFGPAEESMLLFISVLYVVVGIPLLISGILRVAAGWQNYRFRGRTLSLVSIIGGMVSIFSCYCVPTALGLLVYCLILHLNPAVQAAFDMARQGRSVAQILAAFNPYQPTLYSSAAPSAWPNQPPAGETPFGPS
jgi:hypothetical protein